MRRILLCCVIASVGLHAQDNPLWSAARDGRLEQVEQLIERGADVNVSGEIRVGDRTFRISPLAAAALGWHADVARTLLKRGAPRPEFVVRNHNLLPFSDQELDALRDWEVVNTILRTPEVADVTRFIVEREARGTYRTHDGRQYDAELRDGMLLLTAPNGMVTRLQLVGGKAFMERMSATANPAPTQRARTDQDVAMLNRFLQPLPAAERSALADQFRQRGGMWLDFTIGEGRVLGFEIREGGPARLGGAPIQFRKAGVRPEASPLLERELNAARVAAPPLNWPSFRGPGASGVADGQSPITAWDGEKGTNVRWKTAIPGLGHSSPVIWGDRLFLTTAVSTNPDPEFRPGGLRGDNLSNDRTVHQWKVLALDKATGRIVWERTAHEGAPRGTRHLKSTFATPTAATDGRRLVAFFGSEGLYCYDLDGTLIWKKDLGTVGHFSYGFASSPIIFRDMVIVQSDTNPDRKQERPVSFIAAFDLADGRERWRTPRDEDEKSSFGTPTIYDGAGRAQIIANGGTRARAYDPATGREIWSLSAPSDIVTPTPVVARDLIFIMSGNTGYQPIFAIRPTAIGDITPKPGQETNDFVAWSSTRGGSFTPTPVAYGDYLYSINVSGIVGCYDARTGERKYLQRLQHAGSGFSSSPIAADGRLYFASEDGDVFVVKAGPEFELLSTNPMGEVIMATPAISSGMIFIRTLRHLFAIG
jgi:outer membrane protein assembly factor BamB